MLSSEPTTVTSGAQTAMSPVDPGLTMELLELELSLDGYEPDTGTFADHVRAAATVIDGAFLFELPASGLIADCERIAVMRIPADDSDEMATIFACLDSDGTTIRVEMPNQRTADLRNFAEAFVDVLQRI
ncbi:MULTISPECIES: hypothetical protein [unclassified Rhizobium]|uniref:hypothetical protein n=1 Tax=unclassified Rhizobium TaxID=2613769 RepID=UPI0007152DF8|nr:MULTISPECIES: hypothetical protein [unclassified Rhizobium]KQS96337.1 hypothetical protein ASG50_04550 [Rhizobium sp. Leaf386]KQT06176.1 hypothetical protein ASG42_00795 [Rhizobium sp. Leaf391]KQU09589.1 hypothetical protein ASG68_00825 [Rhizobium sp. Leaf453]